MPKAPSMKKTNSELFIVLIVAICAVLFMSFATFGLPSLGNFGGKAYFTQEDFANQNQFSPPYDVFHGNALMMTLDPVEPASGEDTTLSVVIPGPVVDGKPWKKLVYNKVQVVNVDSGQSHSYTLAGTKSLFDGYLTDPQSLTIPSSDLQPGDNIVYSYICSGAIKVGKDWQYVCGCADASGTSCGRWNVQRITVPSVTKPVCTLDNICSGDENENNCPTDCPVPKPDQGRVAFDFGSTRNSFPSVTNIRMVEGDTVHFSEDGRVYEVTPVVITDDGLVKFIVNGKFLPSTDSGGTTAYDLEVKLSVRNVIPEKMSGTDGGYVIINGALLKEGETRTMGFASLSNPQLDVSVAYVGRLSGTPVVRLLLNGVATELLQEGAWATTELKIDDILPRPGTGSPLPIPTGDSSPIIVVGERAPTSEVLLGINVASMLSKDYGFFGGAIGSAVLDKDVALSDVIKSGKPYILIGTVGSNSMIRSVEDYYHLPDNTNWQAFSSSVLQIGPDATNINYALTTLFGMPPGSYECTDMGEPLFVGGTKLRFVNVVTADRTVSFMTDSNVQIDASYEAPLRVAANEIGVGWLMVSGVSYPLRLYPAQGSSYSVCIKDALRVPRSSIVGTLASGETKEYTHNDKKYEITVLAIGHGPNSVPGTYTGAVTKFLVNGQATPLLGVGEGAFAGGLNIEVFSYGSSPTSPMVKFQFSECTDKCFQPWTTTYDMTDMLGEGEEKTYLINGEDRRSVTPLVITAYPSTPTVRFRVDGEDSELIPLGGKAKAGGLALYPQTIYDDIASGKKWVEFGVIRTDDTTVPDGFACVDLTDRSYRLRLADTILQFTALSVADRAVTFVTPEGIGILASFESPSALYGVGRLTLRGVDHAMRVYFNGDGSKAVACLQGAERIEAKSLEHFEFNITSPFDGATIGRPFPAVSASTSESATCTGGIRQMYAPTVALSPDTHGYYHTTFDILSSFTDPLSPQTITIWVLCLPTDTSHGTAADIQTKLLSVTIEPIKTEEPKKPLPCTDTDGGISYSTKGTASQGDKSGTDFCVDDTTLMENDCGYENGVSESSHNNLGSEAHVCANGCRDGACLPDAEGLPEGVERYTGDPINDVAPVCVAAYGEVSSAMPCCDGLVVESNRCLASCSAGMVPAGLFCGCPTSANDVTQLSNTLCLLCGNAWTNGACAAPGASAADTSAEEQIIGPVDAQ